MSKFLNNWQAKLIYILFVSIAIILLFELCYRCQLIDFYATEFNYLNQHKQKKYTKKVLVFGDSFSADPVGYIQNLRNTNPSIEFVNAAAPGIGMKEINCFAAYRIEEVKPTIVLLQLYVGNDLLDIRKPVNFKSIGLVRNCYWVLSDRLLSLRYINYKLGQFKNSLHISVEKKELKTSELFAIEKYSKREKLLLQADSNFIANSINVSASYQDRFNTLINEVQKFRLLVESNNAKLVIAIIPHAIQVNQYYKKNIETLGYINHIAIDTSTNYPFYKKITSAFSGNKSVHVINVLPLLQQADAIANRTYYENDIHLNVAGNSIVSQAIAARLGNLK